MERSYIRHFLFQAINNNLQSYSSLITQEFCVEAVLDAERPYRLTRGCFNETCMFNNAPQPLAIPTSPFFNVVPMIWAVCKRVLTDAGCVPVPPSPHRGWMKLRRLMELRQSAFLLISETHSALVYFWASLRFPALPRTYVLSSSKNHGFYELLPTCRCRIERKKKHIRVYSTPAYCGNFKSTKVSFLYPFSFLARVNFQQWST